MDVRQVKPIDFASLGQIAYQTGFFGESAARFFPSAPLFADLWVRPYLEEGSACNFLAESEGQVLGYIIGTLDLRLYRRWFLGHLLELLGKAVGGGYPHWWESLPYLLRMARYPARAAPLESFPAQLHINLLPQSRGLGLGQRLMDSYLDCLRARGVVGVQLSTTHENQAALKLYERNGFVIFSEYSSPLWRPWLGHDTVHVVMTKSLT